MRRFCFIHFADCKSDSDGKIAATYGLTISPGKVGIKDVQCLELTHGFIPRTTFVIDKEEKL